jgi:hypothetical protein
MKQYGLDTKATADAMNDVSERVAEFSVAGTGAMQDFFDVMQISKDGARAYANEVKDMTGEDITQKLVNDMQDAGVSMGDMNFALKSITNDLSHSAAAFIDNGKAVKGLKDNYNEATKALRLTNGEAEDLQSTATDFDLMTESLGKGVDLIAAQLAPALSDFFNGIITVVPTATQAIVDFINTFRAADEIENAKSINNLIDKQKEKIESLSTALVGYEKINVNFMISEQQKQISISATTESIVKQKERLKELETQLIEVDKKEELAAARKLENQEITGGRGSGGSGGTGDEIQAILDRFKTEEQLLAEKYARELEMLTSNNEETLDLTEEYYENLKEIKDKAADEDKQREEELSDVFKDVAKDDEDAITSAEEAKTRAKGDAVKTAATLNSAFFEDNKAVGAGIIVANTAIAVSEASKLPIPANFAAMALAAVNGAAQLASLNSSSKGGGSLPSVTGSAGAVEAEEFDTSELDIQTADTKGAGQTFNINITSDDTETAKFVSNILNKATVSGDI